MMNVKILTSFKVRLISVLTLIFGLAVCFSMVISCELANANEPNSVSCSFKSKTDPYHNIFNIRNYDGEEYIGVEEYESFIKECGDGSSITLNDWGTLVYRHDDSLHQWKSFINPVPKDGYEIDYWTYSNNTVTDKVIEIDYAITISATAGSYEFVPHYKIAVEPGEIQLYTVCHKPAMGAIVDVSAPHIPVTRLDLTTQNKWTTNDDGFLKIYDNNDKLIRTYQAIGVYPDNRSPHNRFTKWNITTGDDNPRRIEPVTLNLFATFDAYHQVNFNIKDGQIINKPTEGKWYIDQENNSLYSFVLTDTETTFEEIVKQLDSASLVYDGYRLSGWDGPAGLISGDTSWDAIWQKLEPTPVPDPSPDPSPTNTNNNAALSQTNDFTALFVFALSLMLAISAWYLIRRKMFNR